MIISKLAPITNKPKIVIGEDMLNREILSDLANRISEAVPEPAKKMQAQFKIQVEKLIHNTIDDLKLVTREEFDQQIRKLERAEERLRALEEEFEKIRSKLD